MNNPKKIFYYVTKKYNGNQYENVDDGIISSVSMNIQSEDKEFEYKLYDLFPRSLMDQNSIVGWNLTLYTLTNEKDISVDRVKCEYDKKITSLGADLDVKDFINQLISKFNHGRVMTGIKSRTKLWAPVPDIIHRRLNYRQAKKILAFENKYGSFRSSCVASKNPLLISGSVDLGKYVLESWWTAGSTRRSGYSYVTFDSETDFWLNKISKA